MATTDYAMGVSAFTMWFNTDRDYKWHVDSVAAAKMTYDGVNDYFSLDGPGGTRFGFNTASVFGERIRLWGLNSTTSGVARWGFGIQDWTFVMFMDGSGAPTNGKFAFKQTSTSADPSVGTEVLSIHTSGKVEQTLQNDVIGHSIKAHSTQTNDLSQWLDNASAVLLAVGGTGYIEMLEQTAPSAPAVNRGRLYTEDDGAGKTRLMVVFNTGAAQQIAIQP